MGYVNVELVSSAILLDNPGLTREEFIKKLQGVRYSENRERVRDEKGEIGDSVLKPFPLDLRGCESLSGYLSSDDPALHEFAGILQIPYRNEFIRSMEDLEEEDKFGFGYGVPQLSVLRGSKRHSPFEVTTRLEGILSDETKFGRFTIYDDVKEGDVITSTDIEVTFWPVMVDRFVKDWGEDKHGRRIQTIRARWIKLPKKEEEFGSLTELVKAHPYFDPELMYDWNQTEGELSCSSRFEKFKWKKENGGYFLDWETFKNIPETSVGDDGRPNPLVLTYTGLILTAEAVRHRAWKLLSAYGLVYLDDFLTTFPDSKRRYDLAVEDAFLLLPSLKRGEISVEDFARESKSLFYGS